jgi:hypothetical protein
MRLFRLFALFVLTLLMVATSSAGDGRVGLAGTWTEKVEFNAIVDPANPDQTEKFYLSYPSTYTSDGRIILVLPTGAGHPNAGDSRVACLGEWRTRSEQHPREFEMVAKCKYNQAWDGLYAEIRGRGRLSKDGHTFTTNFSYIDYNGDGSINYDEGRGVSYGTRLEF